MNPNNTPVQDGLILNGKFYPIPWIKDIMDDIIFSVVDQLKDFRFEDVPYPDEDVSYTVEQVATLVQKSPATVTRHCRLGLLKGYKVGKSWLIPKENYLSYKLNRVADHN